MSSERKAIKITCIAYAVLAVLYVVSGAVTFAGLSLVDASQEVAVGPLSLGLQAWALVLAVYFVACGVYYLVLSWSGIKAANTPSRMGGFRGLLFAALVVNVGALLLNVLLADALGSSYVHSTLGLCFTVGLLALSSRVVKQTER